jgi:hypothetical protein
MPARCRRIRRWWMTKFFDGLNDSAVAGLSSTPMSFVIRCGTPDCDWGKKMCDLGEVQLRLCYSEFRKHCIQRHDLQEWDTTPHVHLDLEHWMLTLIKT